jgi:hypothetical protein
VRVREFERLAVDVVSKAGHPEITGVVSLVGDDDPPGKHSRLRVDFASGASVFVMVERVTGPGIPRHASFDLPREAL